MFRKYQIRVVIKYVILNYDDWMIGFIDISKRIRDRGVIDIQIYDIINYDVFQKRTEFISKIDIKPYTLMKLLINGAG